MLQELERIVRCAGDMVREAHDIEQVTTEKNGAADLVTKYDVAVQGFLKRELLTLLPEADFFGEEGDHAALTQPWTFIVDPIDGTTNFVRRLHYSNISVALAHDGQVEYAVVYDPFADELFSAQKDCGAFCNGLPIRVSDKDVAHAVLLCGSTIYDAAGSLVVAGAGGTVTTLADTPLDVLHPSSVLATNAKCHGVLKELAL